MTFSGDDSDNERKAHCNIPASFSNILAFAAYSNTALSTKCRYEKLLGLASSILNDVGSEVVFILGKYFCPVIIHEAKYRIPVFKDAELPDKVL